MSNYYNVYLPSYSVGPDCYDDIKNVTARYGKTVVIIGGKTALEKAQAAIMAGIKDAGLTVTDVLWYGGDATYENVQMLMDEAAVQNADMIFAVGGGRAVDTCKTLSDKMGKPMFAFPTIASNCAACTSICVMYKTDGSLAGYHYMKRCCEHTFINTTIIAEAPEKLLWAGIGDALSKEYEVCFASRGCDLPHTPLLGVCLSRACTQPLLDYGQQALEDCRNNKESVAIREVALDIIISTGIVSNLTVGGKEYYYNSSLAHCFYNSYTYLPQAERHLHGEIVSFGTVVLLTYDKQIEERNKIAAFNKALGLPVTLAEMELTEEDIDKLLEKAVTISEWNGSKQKLSLAEFKQAIFDMDAYGKTL